MITSTLRPALTLIALFTLLTGIALPLLATGLATAIVPHRANGSLVTVDGREVGSVLIGQDWKQPGDFHGRPSATTDTDASGKTVPRPDDADSSGGSNLAPTSKALVDRVRASVNAIRAGGGDRGRVPADMVTTSASGLDPDISVADAMLQIPRIAASRHLAPDRLRALVSSHVEGRSLGVFGEPRVDVLALNVALRHPLP